MTSRDRSGRRKKILTLYILHNIFYEPVDFAATAEYFNRPAMHPSYMFVVDVSTNSTSTGLLTAACEAVLWCLDALSEQAATNPGLQVGLLLNPKTYTLHPKP